MQLERLLPILILLIGGMAAADDVQTEFGGHTKLRLIGQTFPSDSLLRDAAGGESIDLETDLRLVFAASRGRWSFDADYQLIALYGDSIEWTREPPDHLSRDWSRMIADCST